MKSSPCCWRIIHLFSGLLLLGPVLVQSAPVDGATLRAAVVVSRHGVRAPIDAPEKLAPYSAQPWPQWSVPPGYLTVRGKQLVTLMGAYYRARYVAAGLLSGDPAVDRARVYFRANNFERTVETARGLVLGLLGEADDSVVHALPDGTVDLLFVPAKAHFGSPDSALAVAAVRARMGPDPDAFARTYRSQFEKLHRILFGEEGDTLAPGKHQLLDLPLSVQAGEGGNDLVETKGPLNLAKTFIENLMLEYAESMPAADVGWGRVDRATFADLAQLHALDFALSHGTFYVAQAQISNMASHVLQTLEQAASGRAVPGAIGPPGARLVVLAGHDMNIISLAGLLNLNWSVDSLPMNPALPGGALVFELWQHADGASFIRTYYMTQTLEQMHTAAPLSLTFPPAIAPVFIPGASTAGPDYESPLGKFAARLRQVIEPQFVAPQS
jgi:4-phytase / acid phosphatase